MKTLIYIIVYFNLFLSFSICGELSVYFPNDPDKHSSIQSLKIRNTLFISTNDLIAALSSRSFQNIERGKTVFYINNHRIKISSNSSFLIVNDNVFQMTHFAHYDGNDIYLPINSFLSILNRNVSKGITYESYHNVIIIELKTFNIVGISFHEKANGTLISFKTNKIFDGKKITGWASKNGWFYLTINGGRVDSTFLSRTVPNGVIRSFDIDQSVESVQFAFQLRSSIEGNEIYVNQDPTEIVLSLRTPLSFSAEKIKMIRDQWYIDTIIIDAGHGGKDSGTNGHYGLSEKFVTLDISRRVGKLLEKYSNVKVVYTREEDVFIPLWKRTTIANNNNGKLFISIHANANKNRRVRGFETYILRPGKTAEAAAVAERENAVIKMEEEVSLYDNLLKDNFIVASLVQNASMKESEDLASMIQTELRKSIPSPDRGVKQAGFYVLVGASMPNILVEVGFLSNPQEEKNLRKPGYRQSIAQSIYNGVRQFKDKYEKIVKEEVKG